MTYAVAGSAAVFSLGGRAAANPFKLRYAPHAGHFRYSAGEDVVDQIEFAADSGFRAWEDNGFKDRDISEQERMAAAMARRDVEMGVFVGADINWTEPTLTSGDTGPRQKFLADIESSIDIARRANTKWMTVVPGVFDATIQRDFQMANVVEALKRAAALLEPHDLIMVLEPLNFSDHPNMFLTGIPQAYLVCKAVDSPSCKILFDVYHQQITEGNIIPNIDEAWDEIAYFQVGDVPGRNEPTTGEINYRNIFRHLYRKGFDGIIGMEHGTSIDGIDGEKALVRAYRDCDDFAV